MFKQTKEGFEKVNTIIGAGTVLEGAMLKGAGTVRIDGKYVGETIIQGDLIIGENGIVEGNIMASQGLIAGTIHGNIVCEKQIHLTSTAVINGNISSAVLIVDEGAKLTGNCQISHTSAPTTKSKPVPENAPKASSSTN